MSTDYATEYTKYGYPKRQDVQYCKYYNTHVLCKYKKRCKYDHSYITIDDNDITPGKILLGTKQKQKQEKTSDKLSNKFVPAVPAVPFSTTELKVSNDSNLVVDIVSTYVKHINELVTTLYQKDYKYQEIQQEFQIKKER